MQETQAYITIGELAERVGITVRTLQYYDQAGILKPSAKGSRNQRLYSEADVEELYRILVMKFLGIQLDDIRAAQHDYRDIESIKQLFRDKSQEMEEQFNELLKHFTALRNLATSTRNDETIDWTRYARIIQDFQDGGKYFWQLSCVYEEKASLEAEEQKQQSIRAHKDHHAKMKAMHELIAQAIVLMHDGVPAEDMRAQEIARKFNEIQEHTGWSVPVNHFVLGAEQHTHVTHHPLSSHDKTEEASLPDSSVDTYKQSHDQSEDHRHSSQVHPSLPSLNPANMMSMMFADTSGDAKAFGELRNDVGEYFLRANKALHERHEQLSPETPKDDTSKK